MSAHPDIDAASLALLEFLASDDLARVRHLLEQHPDHAATAAARMHFEAALTELALAQMECQALH